MRQRGSHVWRWQLTLVTLAPLTILLTAADAGSQLAIAMRWSAAACAAIGILWHAIRVHRRRAFERSLNLWSHTPPQHYRL